MDRNALDIPADVNLHEMTEEELTAFATTYLPGFTPDESGDGYKLKSPTGRVWFKGAQIGDRVAYRGNLGLLNITKGLKLITPDATVQKLDIVPKVADHLRRYEVDLSHVMKMTLKRRNEPVLAIFADDGLQIIDGAHRLTRRILDREETFQAYILAPEALRIIRVQMFRETADEWLLVEGMTDQKMQAAIESGRKFLRVAMSGTFPRS